MPTDVAAMGNCAPLSIAHDLPACNVRLQTGQFLRTALRDLDLSEGLALRHAVAWHARDAHNLEPLPYIEAVVEADGVWWGAFELAMAGLALGIHVHMHGPAPAMHVEGGDLADWLMMPCQCRALGQRMRSFATVRHVLLCNASQPMSRTHDVDMNHYVSLIPCGTSPVPKPRQRSRSHVCPHCNKTFLQHSHLIVHQGLHFGHPSYTCKMCDRAFGTKSNLTRHQKTHRPLEERTLPCPWRMTPCTRKFASRSGLEAHLTGDHKSQRPYACDRCQARFAVNSKLRRHRQGHDNRQPPHACSLCARTFVRQDALKRHIAALHAPA